MCSRHNEHASPFLFYGLLCSSGRQCPCSVLVGDRCESLGWGLGGVLGVDVGLGVRAGSEPGAGGAGQREAGGRSGLTQAACACVCRGGEPPQLLVARACSMGGGEAWGPLETGDLNPGDAACGPGRGCLQRLTAPRLLPACAPRPGLCLCSLSPHACHCFCPNRPSLLTSLSPVHLLSPAVGGHRLALPAAPEGGQHLRGSPEYQTRSPAYGH